jgi:hypothetical protein
MDQYMLGEWLQYSYFLASVAEVSPVSEAFEPVRALPKSLQENACERIDYMRQ